MIRVLGAFLGLITSTFNLLAVILVCAAVSYYSTPIQAVVSTPPSLPTTNLPARETQQVLRVVREDEGRVLELINSDRYSQRLVSLVADESLSEMARLYSQDMFTRHFFEHKNPEGESLIDRLNKVGLRYAKVGENLAYGFSLEQLHQDLMNSSGHRDNILGRDFRRIGIGIVDYGINGKIITEIFAT